MSDARTATPMSEHTAENDAGRDAILDAAIKRHDLLYGTDHCDRKYLLSCHRMPEIILSLPKPARVTPPVMCACGALALTTTGSERHDRGLHGAERCIGFPSPLDTRVTPPGKTTEADR